MSAAEPPAEVARILEQSEVPAAEEDFNWELSALLDKGWQLLQAQLGEPLQLAAKLAVYLATACLSGLLAPAGWKRCIDAVAVLGFGAVSLAAMMDLVSRTVSTAVDSQNDLLTFVPAFSAVLALGGQGAGAAMYSGMFLAMATFLSLVIERLLLPVLQIYLCFAVSAALWGNPGIEEAARLFSRCLSWLLKGCGALFAFVLGLQGLLAGNSDSAGLRMGKSLLAGFLPVVGDAAAAALESSVSAVRLLKGSLALAAILAAVAAFLPVVLQCALYYLAFSAAGVLASATGQRQCGQICRLFSDGAGLCASVLVLYFFLVFLSTMLVLITGSGG